MMNWLQRTAKRIRPPLVTLSRNRPLMCPMDAVDRLISLSFKEARHLPPNRLRLRIGAGGAARILFNQFHFRYMAVDFWMHAFATGLVQIDSNIVDLGCGCGRFAVVLHRLNHKGCRFRGTYTGIDVDREMIQWCQRHFPPEQFRFIRVDRCSKVYNPTSPGKPASCLPLEDNSQDFIFSASLLTHLLDDDFANYIKESHRVLKPGRSMYMSVFCIEHLTQGARRGRAFDQRVGPAYVADAHRPEAAVAYGREHLLRRCREAGFQSAHIEPHGGQNTLLAIK